MTGDFLAGFQSVLDPKGPQSKTIADLWWLFLSMSSLVFAVVLGTLVWPVIRGERPSGPSGSRTAAIWISSAMGVTTLILGIVLWKSFTAGRSLNRLHSDHPVSIRITGHQWWWEVQYDDALPSNQFTTANEIHIPVGEKVELKLRSDDVIHSLWVPNLHGKTDMIPGYETVTSIQADEPGTYRGQCAEFCGHQHAHMGILVIAEPRNEYERWLERLRKPAETPGTPGAIRGKNLFLSSQCASCHEITGTSAGSRAGPSLTHLKSRINIGAELAPNTPENLARWITDTQTMKPGSKMPPSAFDKSDLTDLVSYLESLR